MDHSLTGQKCRHDWQWYFANSFGLLFNRENWSGPLNYPYAQEFSMQRAEEQRKKKTETD